MNTNGGRDTRRQSIDLSMDGSIEYPNTGQMQNGQMYYGEQQPYNGQPVYNGQIIQPDQSFRAFGPDNKNRRPLKIVGIAAGLVIVAVIAVLVSGLFSGDIEVPDVSGMNYDQAKAEIEDAGLRFSEGQGQPSDTVPEGYVVSQNPAPGESLEKGATVQVCFSIGLGKNEIPDVCGLDPERAAQELADAGYEMSEPVVVDGYPEDAGDVIRMEPKAGSEIERGTKVTVYVSNGKLCNVPNVVGLYDDEAYEKLERAGLKVNEEWVDSSCDYGVVVEQSKKGTAHIGDVITIYISLGDDYWDDYEDY
ncbi:MAG: PASTA domain-containing protein [Bacillota bacterium]|nr:PASTA domain-containing protein [Bacillota bacterium]